MRASAPHFVDGRWQPCISRYIANTRSNSIEGAVLQKSVGSLLLISKLQSRVKKNLARSVNLVHQHGGWKLVPEGKVSLIAFTLGLSVILLPSVARMVSSTESLLTGTRGRIVLVVHIAGLNGLLLLLFRAHLYQVAIRACFLGFVFGSSVLVSCGHASWRPFGWYLCSLTFFHYSEYLITAIYNPQSLSLDSFLLNHSFEYTVAAISSWVEFTVEKFMFPEVKQMTLVSVIGLVMVIIGEGLRKAAMVTAGSNFNHIVQNEKSESHVLVKNGVYAWFRHPSYVGWFYWSIGTQVMLCNPLCMIGYTLASWRFFRERIEEEEITLIKFFGEEYLEYKKCVPTGLPFIHGLKVEL
ncbi:protein-S-isoprenylcysteine O-methyltransferase [Protopterus annectens]|uniref:protein-S-isoprenylcysteine O-methyltransferase n=1 Tax=Protopterus annectens TaxID=7888 RepID=UPI001CFB04E3|nr:protein-S-isoprenylcysteine O-methyltransferase [Protopterus annectens]